MSCALFFFPAHRLRSQASSDFHPTFWLPAHEIDRPTKSTISTITILRPTPPTFLDNLPFGESPFLFLALPTLDPRPPIASSSFLHPVCSYVHLHRFTTPRSLPCLALPWPCLAFALPWTWTCPVRRRGGPMTKNDSLRFDAYRGTPHHHLFTPPSSSWLYWVGGEGDLLAISLPYSFAMPAMPALPSPDSKSNCFTLCPRWPSPNGGMDF